MARKSPLRKLPAEFRDELDRLLRDGKHTVREVTDHLRTLGVDTSKSSVHRYAQDFERVAEDIRFTREMARAIGKELGESSGNDATRLLVESLHALILRARMQLSESEEIEARDVSDLARAVKDLGSALKGSVDLELKIREQVARDAANATDAVLKSAGISAETSATIRETILGVARG